METNFRGFLRDRVRLIGWMFVACVLPGTLLLTAGVNPGVALALVFLGSAVAAWRANPAMLTKNTHPEVAPLLRKLDSAPMPLDLALDHYRARRDIYLARRDLVFSSRSEVIELVQARLKEVPDLSVSLSDRLSPEIVGDFVAKAKAAGFSIGPVENRAPEQYAAIAWSVPTVIVLFVSRNFVGTLLTEHAKDVYQATKTAMLGLVRSTSGSDRTIKTAATASSPHKVTPGLQPSLSVRILHPGQAGVWFFFPADLESGLHAQAVQALLHLAHELSSSPVDEQQGGSARPWRPLVYTFDSAEAAWQKVPLLPAGKASESE